LFNKSNKSSGNPFGNGEISGIFNEKGVPKPGMGNPLGPSGNGIDTSFGEQGIQ
jgi:hypothetical protein